MESSLTLETTFFMQRTNSLFKNIVRVISIKIKIIKECRLSPLPLISFLYFFRQSHKMVKINEI